MPPQCGRKRQGRGCARFAPRARSACAGGRYGVVWRRARRAGRAGDRPAGYPLVPGGLLRLYCIALSYGFDCHSDRERRYLSCWSRLRSARERERERFAASAGGGGRRRLTLFGMGADAGPDGLRRRCSRQKFVQGLPLVGIRRRFAECLWSTWRVTACAARAYERRWLLEQENREKKRTHPVWLGCVFLCDRAQIGAYRDLVADKVKQRTPARKARCCRTAPAACRSK